MIEDALSSRQLHATAPTSTGKVPYTTAAESMGPVGSEILRRHATPKSGLFGLCASNPSMRVSRTVTSASQPSAASNYSINIPTTPKTKASTTPVVTTAPAAAPPTAEVGVAFPAAVRVVVAPPPVSAAPRRLVVGILVSDVSTSSPLTDSVASPALLSPPPVPVATSVAGRVVVTVRLPLVKVETRPVLTSTTVVVVDGEGDTEGSGSMTGPGFIADTAGAFWAVGFFCQILCW